MHRMTLFFAIVKMVCLTLFCRTGSFRGGLFGFPVRSVGQSCPFISPESRVSLGKEGSVPMAKKPELFKQKLVLALLSGYNESVGDESKIEVDKVVAALLKEGGGVEASAAEMSFEDISQCGVPKAVARAIAKVWRAPEVPETKPVVAEAPQAGGLGPMTAEFLDAFVSPDRLSDATLLAKFKPTERPDIVFELNKRAESNAFLVYKDKRALVIDQEMSLANLGQLRIGIEIGDTVSVKGVLQRLYKATELPDAAYEICPIHGVHLVGPDQYCPKCQTNWAGVSSEVRELSYVHVNEVLGDVPEDQSADLHLLLQAVSDKEATNSPYFNAARMELERYKSTGKVIVLVKPPAQRVPARR